MKLMPASAAHPIAIAAFIAALSACSSTPGPSADPTPQGSAASPPAAATEAAAASADSVAEHAAATPLLSPPPPPPPPVLAAPPRELRASSASAKQMAVRGAAVAGFVAAEAPIANTERYQEIEAHGITRTLDNPVSTFSVDVDTGSYANVRRMLRAGRLPPSDAVRVEEFINSFRYRGDSSPSLTAKAPFAVHTEIGPSPWNARTRLLRVALNAAAPEGPLPPSNLVFLVDVSGSMSSDDKLPLVKQALLRLSEQMGARDRISLVTYAGATKVVLASTPGDAQKQIAAAINQLDASGGTHGESGLRLAYAQARAGFIAGGNNRVLLATDGDFNLGLTRTDSLIDIVKAERASGIALTTLGFGTGNYNDHLMEQIADAGDGNYSYIDSLQEAEKVLVDQRAATLLTVARNVKVQVEFNPAVVAEYRLIGYENRALKREDFTNDAVDAGELGAGHRVTALYELAIVGEGGEASAPLRYASKPASTTAVEDELGFVRLRYMRPGADASQEITTPLLIKQAKAQLADTSPRYRLAAAVAGFGQKLRASPYLAQYRWQALQQLAAGAEAAAADADVRELQELIALAAALQAPAAAAAAIDGQ